MKYFPFLFWLILSIVTLNFCGREEIESSLMDTGPTDLIFSANTSSPSIQTTPPAFGQNATDPISNFIVEFTFSLESSSQRTVVYNQNNWGLYFGNGTQTTIITPQSPNVTITQSTTPSDPNALSRAIKVAGDVKFTLSFTNQQLPDNIFQATTLNGTSRTLDITVFYDPTGTGNFQNAIKYPTYSMRQDKGAIKNQVSLSGLKSFDGTASFLLTPPDDLSAVDGTSGSIQILPQPSRLSGYLVVYWKNKDCLNSSSWSFKPNPWIVKTGVTPPTSKCVYLKPNPNASQCSLGCDPTVKPDYNGYSLETSAIPDFPSLPPIGQVVEQGCFNLLQVPASQSTVALSNLDDNETYGVFAYPIDSSGSIGLSRSSCLVFIPKETPLLSTTLDPSLVRDNQACMVSTVSGGDSSTAHYWRVLRDRYLTQWGLSSIYEKYSPDLASFLREHTFISSLLKPILWVSGYTGVKLHDLWESLFHRIKVITTYIHQFIFPIAEAASYEGLIEIQTGPLMITQDQNVFTEFYPDLPWRFLVSYTYGLGRLFSLGVAVDYLFNSGTAPMNDNSDPIHIGFYNIGLYALANFHFFSLYPMITPLLSVRYGLEKFREGVNEVSDTPLPGAGFFTQGLGLTLSIASSLYWLGNLSPDEISSQGLKDFMLSLFIDYRQNLNPTIPIAGISYGLGMQLYTE